MGVQTGSDLLGVAGRRRRRLAQARLAKVVLSSVRLARGRATRTRELVIEGGDICNPSITRHAGRLLVAARRPSYRLVGEHLRLAPGRTLESETFVLGLDDALGIVDVTRLETGSTTERLAGARDGLEDPRLFTVGDRLLCLWSGLSLGSKAPSRDHDGLDWAADWSETTNTMVLAEIRGHAVVDPRPVPSPTGRPREKNWMPVADDEQVRFVYYLADGEVVDASDAADGQALRTVEVPTAARRALAGWSGSSQAIPWEGGRLCVVHLALRGIPLLTRLKGAVYLHRFVVLAPDGRVTAISRPFRFLGLGVEFCAGAVVDGDDLLLSFGVDDHRAFVSRTPVSRVRAMLRPVR